MTQQTAGTAGAAGDGDAAEQAATKRGPKKQRRTLTLEIGAWQALAAALLLMVGFAGGWMGYGFIHRDSLAHDPNERLILQAWDDIDKNYVVTGAIDHKKMAYAAIAAMVGTLNDTGHSRFAPRDQLTDQQNQLNDVPEAGIGTVLSGGSGTPVRVRVVFAGSPAAASGLQPGDVLEAADGVALEGKALQDVRALLIGPAQTPVRLTVLRPGQPQGAPYEVTIVRAFFVAPSVESYLIPGVNVLDVHVIQFSGGVDDELQQALRDALAHGVRGIVLDLRDDPGGYLDEAVQVASEFIPAQSGANVLIERTRDGDTPVPVSNLAAALATDVPVVVLVNGGTASSAEVAAGAIAVDRPGVHVVGERTAGTGTILETLYLADGSALLLGTSEWLLPNGRSIFHEGLAPDQPVALADDAIPLSPTFAKLRGFTLAQVEASGDAQLVQAIRDVAGQE